MGEIDESSRDQNHGYMGHLAKVFLFICVALGKKESWVTMYMLFMYVYWLQSCLHNTGDKPVTALWNKVICQLTQLAPTEVSVGSAD